MRPSPPGSGVPPPRGLPRGGGTPDPSDPGEIPILDTDPDPGVFGKRWTLGPPPPPARAPISRVSLRGPPISRVRLRGPPGAPRSPRVSLGGGPPGQNPGRGRDSFAAEPSQGKVSFAGSAAKPNRSQFRRLRSQAESKSVSQAANSSQVEAKSGGNLRLAETHIFRVSVFPGFRGASGG